MSGTTSATGGYLAPLAADLDDDGLSDVLETAVAGITGLPGQYVRPRWQATPPTQPDPTVNWVALGILAGTPDYSPYIRHDGTGDGTSTSQRHEDFALMASFYGPGCRGLAAVLRDGLYIDQNRETLRANGIALVDIGAITAVPDLVNNQWINRCDVTVNFRRRVDRTYAVLNILSASGALLTDDAPPNAWNVEQ